MTSRLRALWRLLRALLHLLRGLFIMQTQFGRLSGAQRFAHIQIWSRQLLAIVGLKLQVHGEPPRQGPLLVVANHISWIDIAVLHSVVPCRFVAKSELQKWPLIGSLSTSVGSLYVERDKRRDAMRVVHTMAEALRAGDMIAVFPEGTTSHGQGLLPFHANLLQAAISADAPVQSLALRFTDAAGQWSAAPSYVGEESLGQSVWRTLCSAPLQAHVWVGSAQHAQGRERRALAHDLQHEVQALLDGSGPAAQA